MEQSPSSAAEGNALRTALVTVPQARPVGEGLVSTSSDTPDSPCVSGCVGGRHDLETALAPEPEDAPSPPRKRSGPTRGTCIPNDFAVTPEMVQWARENTPHVDGRYETEKFCDYWRAKSGREAAKRNWVSTWRNWMRKAEEQATQQRAAGRGSTRRTTDDKVNKLLAIADEPPDAPPALPRGARPGPQDRRTGPNPPGGIAPDPPSLSAPLSASQRLNRRPPGG